MVVVVLQEDMAGVEDDEEESEKAIVAAPVEEKKRPSSGIDLSCLIYLPKLPPHFGINSYQKEKYVPPARRQIPVSESDIHLRKVARGQLNR
jgi:hypothetical protein